MVVNNNNNCGGVLWILNVHIVMLHENNSLHHISNQPLSVSVLLCRLSDSKYSDLLVYVNNNATTTKGYHSPYPRGRGGGGVFNLLVNYVKLTVGAKHKVGGGMVGRMEERDFSYLSAHLRVTPVLSCTVLFEYCH